MGTLIAASIECSNPSGCLTKFYQCRLDLGAGWLDSMFQYPKFTDETFAQVNSKGLKIVQQALLKKRIENLHTTAIRIIDC